MSDLTLSTGLQCFPFHDKIKHMTSLACISYIFLKLHRKIQSKIVESFSKEWINFLIENYTHVCFPDHYTVVHFMFVVANIRYIECPLYRVLDFFGQKKTTEIKMEDFFHMI